MEVPSLTKVDIVFPAHALDWMPAWEEIPEEFREGHTEWNQIANSWFAHGLREDVAFYPKEGVIAEDAFNAVRATLGSYAPKHEHKIAAVAYMLSCWFKKIENWR